MEDFINDQAITDILDAARNPSPLQVKEIIAKARELKGLDPEEVARLLQVEDNGLNELIFEAAHDIKNAIYGNRLVMFAPLYTSNYCSNNCLYCGFRKDNKGLKRVSLTMEEIAEEVRILERQGHKRLLMLCGEQKSRKSRDYFIDAIGTAYATMTGHGGEIRRINVEVAPQDVEGFRRLKAADIGTYVLFQETYHHDTYKVMHPSGPKADYRRTLTLLRRVKQLNPRIKTKSGVMVGLGETLEELLDVLADLRERAVDFLTVGQYLQPDTARYLPVARYWRPAEFTMLERAARALGFREVAAGPFVRSSYHAREMAGKDER